MSEQAHDYSEYTDDMPLGDNALAALNSLARDHVRMEARVAALDEELKKAKEQLRLLSEVQIPEQLKELNLTTVTTGDGIKLELSNAVRANIKKEHEADAFKYLNETGNGNLIKRSFTIEFGKDEESWAKKFQADLNKRKKPLNVKLKRAVHPGTLTAFIKGELEKGVNIPMETFGVFNQTFTKVTVNN